MLPAAHNRLVMAWFDRWCRRAMAEQFFRVHLFGQTPRALDQFNPTASRLYVGNHCSFWDALVVNHLIRPYGRRRFCMADEVQVRKHPFFTRVGGFSVNRKSPRDGLAAVRYAAEQLADPRPTAMLIFPQGEIRPRDERPLAFEGGVGRIVEKARGVDVVPLALHYEFWMEQRPEALVWVGEPMRFENQGRREVVAALERSVEEGISTLKEAGLRYRAGDRIVLHGRRSISRWKKAFRLKRKG